MAWKYLSQTAPNDDGDYTMTWKTTGDKILVTKHNIWEHLYDRNVQDDVHEAGDTVDDLEQYNF